MNKFFTIVFIEYVQIPDIQRIHCPNNCGRSYSGNHRSTNLKRHLRYECGIDPQFTCLICQKRFSFKSDLNRHLMSCYYVSS